MPTVNPFEHPLLKFQRAVEAAKPEILQTMGTLAVNFIHENFEKQGFQGAVFEPWAARKKETPKTAGKHILTNTAALRNSTYFSIVTDEVIIKNAMPYAQIHNEGGIINHAEREGVMNFARNKNGGLRLGKIQTQKQRNRIVAQNKHTIAAHETHMPKRKFAGNSPVLTGRIDKMAVSKITDEYKKL